MATANPQWRFDAVDIRAGMAFATWRDDGPRPYLDRQCLYFGPPYFSAEPVANVAFALSASRGSFAPGLLIRDREAGFDTAEEVSEFLRRAYIGSAGGDGGDAPEGPEGKGGPPGFPKEPPRQAGDGGKGAWGEVHWQIERFRALCGDCDFGESRPFSWSGLSAYHVEQSIARGAELVGVELLALRNAGKWVEPTLERYQRCQAFARALGSSHAAREMLRASPFYDSHYDQWIWRDWARIGHDPLDILSLLPVPTFAQSALPLDTTDTGGLSHLLAVFIASPSVVSKHPQEDLLIDVTLFAAACIANAHHFSGGFLDFREKWAIQTDAWLREHLPRRAFSDGYEDVISNAKTIRYGPRA